jgi:hypothetical protein
VAVRFAAPDQCCASLNVEPFRVQPIRETSCVSLVRFDHPSGIPLPTSYSLHDAAENFRVNIVERGWFKLKYGRREWTLGAGSMFLSRPTEVYGYSHVKYAEPDTCLRVEFSGPIADQLRRSVFRLPLVLPTTNRLSFLRLRLSALLSNAAEMSVDALACELVDAAANAEHDGHRLYRHEQLCWYAERVVAAPRTDRLRSSRRPLFVASLVPSGDECLSIRTPIPRVGRDVSPQVLGASETLLRTRPSSFRHGSDRRLLCIRFYNLSHFINSFRAHLGYHRQN